MGPAADQGIDAARPWRIDGSAARLDGSSTADAQSRDSAASTDGGVAPTRPDSGVMRVDGAVAVRDSGAPRPDSGVVPPAPDSGIAPPALNVQITWDTNNTDLDLHLVRPGSQAFAMDGGDCYYAQRMPDWGTPGDPSDDPSLDIDDVNGLGPEALTYRAPPPGTYKLYVHYYADNGEGPTQVSVDFSVLGRPVPVTARALLCNDLWHVGDIVWDGADAVLRPGLVTQEMRGNCN